MQQSGHCGGDSLTCLSLVEERTPSATVGYGSGCECVRHRVVGMSSVSFQCHGAIGSRSQTRADISMECF